MTSRGYCPEARAALVEAAVRARLAEQDWPAVRRTAVELARLSPGEFAARVEAAFRRE